MTKKTVKKEVKSVAKSKKVTQTDTFVKYLNRYGKISRTKAISIGIKSVNSVVRNLREKGMDIQSSKSTVKGKNQTFYAIVSK